MNSFIVVITRQPQTRRQVARALYAGGMEIRFLDRSGELKLLPSEERPALVIVDADTCDADAVHEVLAILATHAPPRIPVILLSLGSDKEALLTLIQRHDVGNLVAKHGAIRAVHPVLDERELLVTCTKVIEGDIFGVEKYVGVWGVKVHQHLVRTMPDKQRVLSEFEGYLTDLEAPSPVVPDILTVADELMLNAMVHAPRDAEGQPKYEHLGPREDLVLEEEDTVTVTWACDGQRLAFAVSDRFGALDRQKIHEYVAKGFGGKRQSVETKPGGAGLGLAMSVKRLHQLVFNIQERVRTEVIAGWYLRLDSASEFRQVSKSINVFWLPETGFARDDHARPVPVVTRARPTGMSAPQMHAVAPPALPAPAAGLAAPAVAPAEPPVAVTAPTSAPTPPPEDVPSSVPRQAKGISGRIDERFNAQLPDGGPLRLDMRGVTGFSSAGVIAWLRFMKTLVGRSVEFTALPEVVVRTANEVENLLGGFPVRSVLAPFECPSCSQSYQIESRPQQVMADVVRPCPSCKGPLRFAGSPLDYEGFLDLVTPNPGA